MGQEVSGTLGEETPGKETPGKETPGEETLGEETPGRRTLGEKTLDNVFVVVCFGFLVVVVSSFELECSVAVALLSIFSYKENITIIDSLVSFILLLYTWLLYYLDG